MNWVGGARNRVKGTHKNELRLQKEYFERKRLQLKHSAQVGNVENNTTKPKKAKVSQDIISFQRQCRVNAGQGINTTPNFRRVDFNSRSLHKGVNKFGVNAVELPMSPIDKPSMLQLSSPPTRNGALFSRGPIPHCNSTATSSMNQSSCLDLFGEPMIKPHRPITNRQQPANHGTFNNKACADMAAPNEPFDVLAPYRPSENSRDFSSPLSPESEYGRENHTVPGSFCPNMFNNDMSSLYECHGACHQYNKHKENDFSHSSCFQVDSQFDLDTTTCSDGCTQPLFGEKKKKRKFSVRIVPSPESQRSLSSETSTLNNWPQTNDARIPERVFNHLDLLNEGEYPPSKSGQRSYLGIYEPNALAQWKHQHPTRWPPQVNEQNSSNGQTHMTNIKGTRHGSRICHRPQIWTNYDRQAMESFPTPASNYCEQAPSTCFVVSSGLDSTPNTSYRRNASPLEFRNCKSFEKAGVEPNSDVHIGDLVRLEPCQMNNQCEDPTKSINPGKQITISTLNRIRSPVEIAPECMQSTTSSLHSKRSTCSTSDEKKIARGTTHSQPSSVAATPSCKSTNLEDETKTAQDASIQEFLADKHESDITISSQIVETLGVDLVKCKALIVSPRDIREHGHVTSSADVSNTSQSKEYTEISNSEGLSVSTQTTPKVFRDTASSPIKEVTAKPKVNLPSYSVDDSRISSSVYNSDHDQTV